MAACFLHVFVGLLGNFSLVCFFLSLSCRRFQGSAIPDIGAGGGWGNDLVPGKYLFHMDLGDANAVQALVSKKTPAGSPRTAANGLSHADVVVKSEAKLQRASQNQFGTGSAVSSTVPAVAMMLAVANASPSRAVNIAKLPTASAVPADATGDSSKASIRRHSNGGGAGPQLNKGGAGEGMK
uniref:Uncharacterized protein n=1 Tax=Lotharella globosa TaxID=91324 RepID=A0A7S3YTI1_9EUKA